MSKIGVAIKITYKGDQEPVVVNGGKWERYVIDGRNSFSHVPYAVKNNSPVVFISYVEDALIITVARTINGRDTDNVAGWIHIPNNIKISGGEVVEIVEKVKKLILATELPEDEVLNAEFGKVYPPKQVSARYEASNREGKFAKRDTIRYPLAELLDEKYRYQSYYSQYRAIFLVEDVKLVENADDLSNKQLAELITFLPPTTRDMDEKLGRFVTLRLESGQEFNDALLLNKNQNLTLTAERDGFEPVTIKVTAERDGQICPLQKTTWHKRISASMFEVKSESGKSLDGRCSISVNGHNITNNPFFFTEKECEKAEVKVTSERHEPFSRSMNLLGADKKRITLERQVEEYHKKILLKNGSIGNITLSGKGINRGGSPIKGYVEDEDFLEYDTNNLWLQRLMGFGAAVAIGAIVWGSIWLVGWIKDLSNKFSDDQEKPQIETTVDEPQTPVEPAAPDSAAIAQENAAAIAYLDSAKEWQKPDMEKYKLLIGLFDDLNNMNREAITTKWKETLKDSERFAKVVTYTEKNLRNNGNPFQAPHSATYNSDPNDYKITVQGYINWMDQSIKKKSK